MRIDGVVVTIELGVGHRGSFYSKSSINTYVLSENADREIQGDRTTVEKVRQGIGVGQILAPEGALQTSATLYSHAEVD